MLTFSFGTQLQEGLGISFREGLHRPPSLCAARNAYCFFSSLLYSIELIIAQKFAVVKRFKMTYKNKVASLHSVWRSDKARTAEGLHIMADNIINLSHTLHCTSPMCAQPIMSIQRRDWPMPPPIVSGSSPARRDSTLLVFTLMITLP